GLPPHVAHPEAVDLRVRPRRQAVDLVLVGRRVDVAAARAAGADRRHVAQEPDARVEAERRPGERPDRADVDGVAGVGVVQRLAREGGDDRVAPAVEQPQLAGLADLVAEADAARALDAALAVEHDARADRVALLVMDLLLHEAALSRAVGV